MDNREIELQALITEREGMIAENVIRRWSNPPYDEEDFDAIADKMRALKKPGVTITLPKNLEDLPKGEPLPSVEDPDGDLVAQLAAKDDMIDCLKGDRDSLIYALKEVLPHICGWEYHQKAYDLLELVCGHRS